MNLKKIDFNTMCKEILNGSTDCYYIENCSGDLMVIVEISLMEQRVCYDCEELTEFDTWLKVEDAIDFWKRED